MKSVKKYVCYGLSSLLLVGALGFLGNLYWTQEDAIFQQKYLKQETTFDWPMPTKELFLPVGKDKMNALLLEHPNPKGSILYLHGRNKDLSDCEPTATLLYNQGYTVFVIDYRGYGKSTNRISEETLLQDAEAAYTYLKTVCPDLPLTIYGESMGTAMAIWVASHHPNKHLILEAPFASLLSVAQYTKKMVPKPVLALILKYHMRSDQWIKNVSSPITVFHGSNDTLIPIEQSHELLQQVSPKTKTKLLVINDWGHKYFYKNEQYRTLLSEVLL